MDLFFNQYFYIKNVPCVPTIIKLSYVIKKSIFSGFGFTSSLTVFWEIYLYALHKFYNPKVSIVMTINLLKKFKWIIYSNIMLNPKQKWIKI